MRPIAQPIVPSRRLLRFLRSQSEGVPFFHPSHGHSESNVIGRRLPLAVNASPKVSSRRFSTSRRLYATTLEAGIWDLESIIPKSVRAQGDRSSHEYFNKNATQRRFNSTDDTRSPETCVRGLDNRVRGPNDRVRGPDDRVRSPEAEHYKKSWQERLWGPSAAPKSRQGNDLDDVGDCGDNGVGESAFHKRRIESAKAALEPRLRCTEVDENGEIIVKEGEFKKSELIAKYGLMPRDLRKIDSSNLPHIFVRPSVILINLLHLKVLIKHDRVLLFDVYGTKTSYPQKAFMYDMQEKLRQKQPPGTVGGLPYEFRALEAVLMSVTSALETNLENVQDPVLHVLSDLENDIDRETLRQLLVQSKMASTFEQRAKLVRDAIEELLDADDDLSNMYLTEKTRDISRAEDDHTEVEMLLESYHKICDEVVQEASTLVSDIRNTEEIIRAILDANRNALMLLDLKFSVGTLGFAMGTFIVGMYGMNLENFIEESHYGFVGVTGISVLLSVATALFCARWLRKVQRVSMKPKASAAAHRYHNESPMWMLEARNRERLKRISMMKERTVATGKMKRWWQNL